MEVKPASLPRMPGATTENRRSMLRTSTAALHLDLENAMESRRYFDCVEAYREYLLKLDLFYRVFCQTMDQSQGEMLGRWGIRDHRGWLADDLSYFGMAPLLHDQRLHLAPRIDCRAHAFGAVYVILGSSLGAKALASRAAKLLKGGDAGMTYLGSLRSSHRWPDFLSGLEAEEGLADADILHGATETFASYKAHMTGTPI